MFNNSTLFIGLDLGYALTESVIINNMGEMIKKTSQYI
jgi:hypothetical protein